VFALIVMTEISVELEDVMKQGFQKVFRCVFQLKEKEKANERDNSQDPAGEQ